MTAFLKIDECRHCDRLLPWEWVPATLVNGKALSGTGVWRSTLADGLCPGCQASLEATREQERQAHLRRGELMRLLGGEKPYREFTFERYEVTPESRVAFEAANTFDPAADNVYLWGPCGVGKTHLAWAVARRCFEETLSVAIQLAINLSRKVRMKDPLQEQAELDALARADVLVLDDLGAGSNTAFNRQLLQEILDTRDFEDRAGLVVTCQYSLDQLAAKFENDAIASRLAGLCRVIRIGGSDRRLRSKPHFTEKGTGV